MIMAMRNSNPHEPGPRRIAGLQKPENSLLMLLTIMLCLLVVAVGCTGPSNPAFDLTEPQARQHLRQMQGHPVALERPVVIVGPFLDPGISTAWLKHRVQRALGPGARVIGQSFTLFDGWDRCAEKTVDAVGEAFPHHDAGFTTEVDVIAFSMGGLVARHAAAPRSDGSRRLKIARLFTISTPHQGAKLAELPAINQQMRGMRSGSDFLTALGKREAQTNDDDYPVFAYTRYWDETVSSSNAVPAGSLPLWVPNPVLFGPHPFSFNDPRFIADICRRLRSEPAPSQPAPLPEETDQDEDAVDSGVKPG